MTSLSDPADEERRLTALRQYQLLDTPPEQALDDLTALAAQICETPIALIALADAERQWFKSKHGTPATETPRESSFSNHALAQRDLFIVPDASLDRRFADLPLVAGGPHIRFYAGVPLITPTGEALGTLCVMDRVPRQLTPAQQHALAALGRQAMAQLQLRKQTRELRESEARLRIVTDNARVGLVVVDQARSYVYANRTYAEILGLPSAPIVGRPLRDVLPDVYDAQIAPRLDRAFAGERVSYELHRAGVDGERYYAVNYEPTQGPGAAPLVVVVITDVTQRKLAEAQTTRLSTIVEYSTDAIVSIDLDGLVTSWNGGAEALYGYAAAEMIGASVLRLIPENRRDEEQRILDRIRRDQRVGHFETVRVTKDGRAIDVSVTASPIKDGAGRVIGASKVTRDITDRRQAEAALRASEGRYRTLFDCAADGMVIADRQAYYIDVNASMCQMLGYQREELIGSHSSKIVDPSEIPHIGPALRTLASTASYHREWRLRRKDGSVFSADVIGTLMPDGNLLAVIRDITERKQSLQALQAAEERMRFALENAGVGIWDIDYTTMAVRWSNLMEAQYGIAPGTFDGTFAAFYERIHPDDRRAAIETIEQATTSGADFLLEHRSQWPDGTVRWLRGSGRVMKGAHGEPLRAVGISQDVTERRALEEQYHQAQKMQAVGRLAGGVAHDFNNLLTAILGYCELLLPEFDAADPRRHDVKQIERAGTSAAGLTRQLLAFSRKQIIELRLLDLNAVLTSVRPMLGRLIGEDITVVMSLRAPAALVRADAGQMEQIILNLALNARDAMPRGGTLTIETACVELDANYTRSHFAMTPGAYVVLTVTDTGVGMSPEVQARLFEPFFTTKEIGRGTGLGLATVHGIVARSGGSIGVTSEVGKGASFKVYFPRAEASAVVEAASPVSKPAAASQTVLVVEDEDGLRELAKRLLRRLGFAVLVAANADEALQIFQQNPAIDVLLTDVVMPGTSGPELTRHLLALRPALNVIYMSGYTEDAILQHGVLKPGVAFLHKPFTSETLNAKIHEVLSR